MKYDMLYALCSVYKILQFVYFIYIYFYFFIFCARNIQTIICHRSYVYIFGLNWFIFGLYMFKNGLYIISLHIYVMLYIDLSILSPVRTVMYIIFFMYMNWLIKFGLIINSIILFICTLVHSLFIYIIVSSIISFLYIQSNSHIIIYFSFKFTYIIFI